MTVTDEHLPPVTVTLTDDLRLYLITVTDLGSHEAEHKTESESSSVTTTTVLVSGHWQHVATLNVAC